MFYFCIKTIIFMILQPQHSHQQSSNINIESLPTKIIHNNSTQLGTQALSPLKNSRIQSPSILQNLFSNSTHLISQKGAKQIKQKIQFIQQKVHLSFSTAPNHYLDHLKPQIQKENQQDIAQIIQIQNWLAVNKILSGKIVIKQKSDIKDIGSNIKEKIADMKRSIMSLSSIEKRANAQFQNLLEFRKKNYWAHQTEKSKKVKSFVSKMKRIHSEQKKRQQKQLIQRQQKVKSELQKQKILNEQTKKQMYMKQLEKQALWRKQRSKFTEQQRKKKQKVQELLQRFNADRPFYLRKQQQYVKNILQPRQEERIKKLQEIRAQHQPVDQQQIEQHNLKYQEYKQSLMQDKRKKHQEQEQMNNKLQQQLKELYHCRFHKQMNPRFYNSERKIVVQKVKKIKQYQKAVLENHRPSIDLHKRSKLQEQILDLQLKQDKKRHKVIKQDGSIVIQEKPEFNARRIGVQYLEQMKEQNQGKPRKKEDRSQSMMQISQNSKIKRIDYLRENKPNLKYKKTLGEWKKVIADGSYSPRQKFQSIMQQAMVLQQKAHQKEQMMNSYKKGEKAIELKQQMDKLYLQSVAAKLVVLKDVILKQ